MMEEVREKKRKSVKDERKEGEGTTAWEGEE
jgi:hypothetical protein